MRANTWVWAECRTAQIASQLSPAEKKNPAVARRVSISIGQCLLERTLEAEQAADAVLLVGIGPVSIDRGAVEVAIVIIVNFGRDREAGNDVVSDIRRHAIVLVVVTRHLEVQRGLRVELVGAANPPSPV